MSADLHLHSIYSDGSYTPRELVQMAVNKGLDIIALTDHDTVKGITEATEAGKESKVEVIPAIELSSYQGRTEIHILGYYLDYHSANLLKKLEQIFTFRLTRAEKMIVKLNQLGVNLNLDDVKKMAGDDFIGRPHIARAMVKAGYISCPGEAYTDQLIAYGGKAYVEKMQLTPAAAIDLIIKARGIPVLAHPFIINNQGKPFGRKEIAELVQVGLQGIEVYHSKHDRQTTTYYLNIARELGLLVTGGSDFHGLIKPNVAMGSVRIDNELVERLKEARI